MDNKTPFEAVRLWEIPIEGILGEDPDEDTRQTVIHYAGGNEFFTVVEHKGRYYIFGYLLQMTYTGEYEFVHLHQNHYGSLDDLFAAAEKDYHQWGSYLEDVLGINTDCRSDPVLVQEYYRFNGKIYGLWLACDGLEVGLQ